MFFRVSICDFVIPEIHIVICLLADQKNCLLEMARRGIIATYNKGVVIWAKDLVESRNGSALF